MSKNDYLYRVMAFYTYEGERGQPAPDPVIVVLGHWLSLGTAKADLKRLETRKSYDGIWIEKLKLGRMNTPVTVWPSKKGKKS